MCACVYLFFRHWMSWSVMTTIGSLDHETVLYHGLNLQVPLAHITVLYLSSTVFKSFSHSYPKAGISSIWMLAFHEDSRLNNSVQRLVIPNECTHMGLILTNFLFGSFSDLRQGKTERTGLSNLESSREHHTPGICQHVQLNHTQFKVSCVYIIHSY